MAGRNSTRIDTVAGRKRLAPRKEPFWHRLARYQYVGYRKLADGTGTWHVRVTLPDGTYNAKALKADDTEMTFDQAADLARALFRGELSRNDTPYTLDAALSDYRRDLAERKSATTAMKDDQRLRNHLPAALLATAVRDLTTTAIQDWHRGMVVDVDDPERVRKSKDSANRVLKAFRAALNLAWRTGRVADDSAWRRVKPFKDVGRGRELFLTDDQVAELIDACRGGFRALVEAAVLTGARYGELCNARVRDLDRRAGTLRLDGKTGGRNATLSKHTEAFLTEQARGKLPAAFLFTQDDGRPWGSGDQTKRMAAAVKAAGLPPETVFYSLRHYAISKALLKQIPAQVVAENTGTSVAMLERHYAKFMAADRRAMFNRVHAGE